MKKDYFWASKKDLSRFKPLAVEYGERPWMAENKGETRNVISDPQDMVEETVNSVEEEEDFRFNGDLICEHGKEKDDVIEEGMGSKTNFDVKANPNPKMMWVSDERALAGVHFS